MLWVCVSVEILYFGKTDFDPVFDIGFVSSDRTQLCKDDE